MSLINGVNRGGKQTWLVSIIENVDNMKSKNLKDFIQNFILQDTQALLLTVLFSHYYSLVAAG